MERLGIDKKQENSAPEQKGSGRTILPAEKKFNNRLYWGLNYGVQVTTAVLGSYWIKHAGGKKYFDKAAEWVGEKIIPKVTSKRGIEAIKETNTYLVGATQLAIGSLFFIPIKWYENRKAEHVRKIDNTMIAQQEKAGFAITPEERERHEEALQQLEKEPKASWPTLAIARVAGIGSFFATNWLIGEKRSNWMQSKTADGVQFALKKSKLKPLEELGHSPKVRNFTKLAFIDFFYSIFVASAVLKVTTHLIPKQKRKDKTTEQPADHGAKQNNEVGSPPSFAEKELGRKIGAGTPERSLQHEKFTDYIKDQSSTEPQVSV